MGNLCGTSLTPEEREARLKSKYIEEMNKRGFEEDSQVVKLLLLGAGESGKSTLFKQMKILYGINNDKGFSSKQRLAMTPIIYNNIISNIKVLFIEPKTSLLSAKYKDNKDIVQIFESKDFETTSTFDAKKYYLIAKKLWHSDTVKDIWKKRGRVQVQDSLEYYMDNIERISSSDYMPTDQDILHTRVRTSGIVEEHFRMEDTTFLMVDVGGQRNERRKWIHAFQDVDCIIFVSALSEYNQYLYEDISVNRQNESVELFHKIANEDIFRNNGLVLFLNKSDLFRKKLATIPFRIEEGEEKRNVDYTGPLVNFDEVDPTELEPETHTRHPTRNPDSEEFNQVYLQSLQYLETLYKKQCPPGKKVFIKVTCATDTQQVDHIMNACKQIFLAKILKSSGFTS